MIGVVYGIPQIVQMLSRRRSRFKDLMRIISHFPPPTLSCSHRAVILSAVLLKVSLVVCWSEGDRLGVDSSRPHTVDDDINNLSYHRFGEMRPKTTF